MASTDATAIPVKNQAYRVTFPILDADGDLVTGATSPDSEISKDGGTAADCTNEATEIATSSGMYFLDLTSAEMNADTVAIIVKSGTGKTTPIVMYPQEAGDIKVDVQSISGDSTAADNAEAFFDGTGYAGTNNVIPTVTTVSGAVGSVTGAVGSVTGNVGGNVVGSVASVTGNVDGSVASVTGAVGSVTGAVGSVTGAVGSVAGNVDGNVTGSVGSLAAQAKTDVNAEVVDALATDTYAESSGVVAATSSLAAKIQWLTTLSRNKVTQTATTSSLRNDADGGNIATSTVSDDGTTFTRGEWT